MDLRISKQLEAQDLSEPEIGGSSEYSDDKFQQSKGDLEKNYGTYRSSHHQKIHHLLSIF
jgi:hypothetical protein